MTRKFTKFSSLSVIIFWHILWGFSFGDPMQEVHVIASFILLYLTEYYFLDVIFLSTIKKVERFWAKKFGMYDNFFVEFVEDD